MAFGDDKRARNRLNYGAARGEALGENLRTGTLEPQLRQFRDFYMQAAPGQLEDYSSLMGNYKKFAETGGFSPEDTAAIRARAIAPTRSVYAGAKRDLGRMSSMGTMGKFNNPTLRARMSRELSQGLSDANLNAEASIAEMTQRGKLAGLSGGSSLYSATPGLVSTFGNQVLGATDQLSTGVGREMGHGLDAAGLQIAASRIPGKWENIMGRIGDVADLAGKAGGTMYPWLKKPSVEQSIRYSR